MLKPGEYDAKERRNNETLYTGFVNKKKFCTTGAKTNNNKENLDCSFQSERVSLNSSLSSISVATVKT
jgi:hypothetical protein